MKITQRELETLRTAADLISCNCNDKHCDGGCTHSELLALRRKLMEED